MSLSWFSKTSYRSHAATTSLYLDNWRLMAGCLLFDVGSIDIKGNLAWTEGVGMDPFLEHITLRYSSDGSGLPILILSESNRSYSLNSGNT
jgi:hypothetical protein